jgi:SEC-C motif
MISKTSPAFSVTRKRRKSFPSETQVRRGDRVVHGDVELTEKLGRNDLCPCGSGRRFQTLLHEIPTLRRRQSRLLLSGNEQAGVGRMSEAQSATADCVSLVNPPYGLRVDGSETPPLPAVLAPLLPNSLRATVQK